MYLVIVEWDGKMPPTVYYDRLHKLGLFVRGNKDQGVIERRTSVAAGEGMGGVIGQEGAIVCPSESLARTVANLAKREGARLVRVGLVDFEGSTSDNQYGEDIVMTQEDARIMAKIEQALGKRGRPSREDKDTMEWVVTCYEEATTHQVDDEKTVVNCPSCKGFRYILRPGRQISFTKPADMSVFDYWRNSRFITGRFEVPIDDEGGSSVAPVPIQIASLNEAEVVKMIENSKTSFIEPMEALTRTKNHLYHLLDIVFCNRSYIPKDSRDHFRLEAMTEALRMGANPRGLSFAEPTKSVDILDLAYHLHKDTTASYYVQAGHLSNGKANGA